MKATQAWAEFSQRLTDPDQDWDLWVNWYEERLHGRAINPHFEKALLSLSKEEWDKEPAAINARLKALMEAGRRPAVSNFKIVNGGLEGSSFVPEIDADASIARQIHGELRAQLEKFAARLAAFDGHPVTDDILKDINALFEGLGDNLEKVQSGRLLQLATMLDIAEHRLKAAVSDGQLSVPQDLSIIASALQQQLKNFLGLYDDDLKLIDTRAQTVGVNEENFADLAAAVDDLRKAVHKQEITKDSARTAIDAGVDELRKLVAEVNRETDDEIRAKRMASRDLELGRQIRNSQNVLDAFRVYLSECVNGFATGVQTGFGKAGEATLLGAFAYAAHAIGLPGAVIAALVGGSYAKSLLDLQKATRDADAGNKTLPPDDPSDNTPMTA